MMKIVSLRLLMVLLAGLVFTTGLCAFADEPAKEEAAEVVKGKVLTRKYEFKAAEKEIEYALYVPKSYTGESEFPLIVALHGLYSNPRQIMGYPGLTKGAEKHGYLVVAPMGFNTRGWYGSRGTGGGRRNDPKNLGELSEQDVMNVLAIVRKEFKVDSQRIYLYGHSMGGGGSFHLAIKYPEIWAAIAPMAPAVPRSSKGLENAKHIPAIIVQGDRDGLVSGTRRWVKKYEELEIAHQYIEVKGGGHIFVAWQHFDEIFDFFAKHKRATSE